MSTMVQAFFYLMQVFPDWVYLVIFAVLALFLILFLIRLIGFILDSIPFV